METDQLAELLSQKRDTLLQLEQIAHRQADVVRAGDMTRLFKLLAIKQRILQALETTQRKLDPFRSQEPESRQWRCQADREHARVTARECEQLLSRIMRVEHECEGHLVRRRNEAAARLQSVHNAARASEAYHQSAMSNARIDLSS